MKSTRLPSYNQLEAMSDQNRFEILSAHARDLRAELQLFDEGAITMSNGQRLCDARRNVKRQLDRVYERAFAFDLDVGQPEPHGTTSKAYQRWFMKYEVSRATKRVMQEHKEVGARAA